MDDSKSSQREKFSKMSKNRRETVEVQSDDNPEEDDMAAAVKQSSSASPSSASGKGLQDPGIVHRLTFRADPELLEPPGKQRKKLSRNEIEKLRRDRLNAYFMELAKLVPLVMQSNKKIDKASILRLTVAYLRIYHDLVKGSKRSKLSNNWRPDLNMYENLGNLLLESFGGFLLVINKKGILIFATEAITKYLGHSLSDVLGSEVKNVIHPNDYEILMRQFEMTESDGRIKDTDDETDVAHVPVSGQRSFCIKMLNVLDPQSTCYELMHVVGHLKRMPPVDSDGVPTTFSGTPSSSPEPSVCLVAVAKLVSRQPIQELYPVMDSTSSQWITRHELDGKITYSDQRGALLTGFLPGESIGFSPYSLLHPDDVSSVVTVHNLFLENGCVPLTVFRMFTKSREILYVQTNTHMVIDTWTSKPKFIISINTVLDEQNGLFALEDQNRRIEDQKRCIEVVQNTCCSSTPSPIQDASESSQSIQEQWSLTSPPSVPSCSDVDCIIPEVEEVDESTIDIVVGLKKFRIQMTENPKYDPKSPPHNFSSINMVFDAHATTDDGGKSIPNVVPSFLSAATSSSGSSSNQGAAAVSRANSRAPSTGSCASVIEMTSVDADADQAPEHADQAPEHPSQNGATGDVLHRCVTIDDARSLAELLLQKDGVMQDAGKAIQNRDANQKAGGHLLLRQLLVDKPKANTNRRNTLMDGQDGVVQMTADVERKPTRNRIASLESMSKLRDETMYGEFSQIKSLLREGREPTKRSAAGIQNGRTMRNGDSDSMHGVGGLPSWNGAGHPATSPASIAMPSSTAVLGNVRRSSESQAAATPLGIPYHQIPSSTGTLWPETASRAATSGSTSERFTSENCVQQGLSLDANGTVRDGFTSYVNGNGLAVSQNGKYNGLDGQLRTVTSQESYTNPSRPFAAEAQRNRHVNYLPTSDSSSVRPMECDSDVLHSSVTKIIARLPSADKFKFLRHLMAEQEKVYTIDSLVDDPTMGGEQIGSYEPTGNGSEEMLLGQLNCDVNGSHQSAYTSGQSVYTSGQSAYTSGQSAYTSGQSAYTSGQSAYTSGQPTSLQTSVDAVTLNGWCQDFGVTDDGGYDLGPTTSSSSLNCWMPDGVIGFDDLFLAQQNDISVDWKGLVDDL